MISEEHRLKNESSTGFSLVIKRRCTEKKIEKSRIEIHAHVLRVRALLQLHHG